MTEKILQMMEERRSAKKDSQRYKVINKQIQKEIRKANESWIQEQCREIESLQEKYDSFNVHRKVKEAARLCRPKTIGCLTNRKGQILINTQDKLTWEDYIKQLFHDKKISPTNANIITGPLITTSEVEAAIKQLKCNKSPGPDKFYVEFLKLLDEDGIKWLTEIFNNIYDTGKIPEKWLVSEFITLLKKASAKRCDEYRTISLLSQLLKVFLKIIHKRFTNYVKNKC